MNNKIGKRLVSSSLAVAVFFSVLGGFSPSAFASNSVIDSAAVLGDVFKSAVNSVVGAGKVAADVLDQAAKSVSFRFSLNRTDLVSPDELLKYIDEFNSLGWLNAALATNNSLRSVYEQAMANLKNNQIGRPHAYPRPDPTTGNNTVRPYIDGYGWLVDANGNYPYCDTSEYNSHVQNLNSGIVTPKPFSGRWLTTNSIRDSKKTVQKSYADMDATKADLANEYPSSSVTISNLKVGNLECKVIRRLEEGPGNRDWVWCDPNGLPYVYIDPDTQGAAQDWNYDKIQEITNNQTEDIKDIVLEQGDKIDKLIDVDTNTTLAPNVTIDPSLNIDSLLKLNIDKITVDMSDDRTIYTVDSHDVTYNVENNFYEYNYYTYNYEFTYNNTYVTYVGSTAEYQPKEWSLYYQLPDGRSSADLTEEDVAGLSFQFQDVINYKRASTSADLWALYHFDGNTDDDSYYAAEDSFHWDQGASINYMEANAFGGALYLDEQSHQFTLTLPSNLGTKDFTLQWRYYQNSAITSENADNYITTGGKVLLRWSEKNLYLSGSSEACTNKLSIGSWQELALVRSGGTLFLYHNGVAIASTSISGTLGRELVFSLGGSSRAYSMIDELRLITRPIATGGNYTPTAVPYDSNSVLVLPGESTVVDSYYKWDTTITPVFSFDVEKDLSDFHEFTVNSFRDETAPPVRNKIYTVNSPNVMSDGSLLTLQSGTFAWDYPITSSAFGVEAPYQAAANIGAVSHPGFVLVLSDPTFNAVLLPQSTLSLTFVGANLERYTVTLDHTSGNGWSGTFPFGVIKANYSQSYDEDDGSTASLFSVSIQLYSNSSFSFRYVELVPGSQPNTGHQLVTDTYNTADLQPNTAAVQTDIPIKGYTVGGVRPTFPSRGDVWFPAEGNRISGVQVYNGQAWEETNARWWTGKRWIPIYAFDLVTLADMWDVGSSTGQDVTPTITTEIGFWNWWKNQWLEFRAWLATVLSGCEHDYVEEVLLAPTCVKEGVASYTCSKCHERYFDKLEPLGHDWVLKESVPDETKNPPVINAIPYLIDSPQPDYPDAFDSNLDTGDHWEEPITFLLPKDGPRRFRGFTFRLSLGSQGDWLVGRVNDPSVYDYSFPLGDTGINLPVSVLRDENGPYSMIFDFSVLKGHDDYKVCSIVLEGTVGFSGVIPGYDVYVCSRCGEEYVDKDRVGPSADIEKEKVSIFDVIFHRCDHDYAEEVLSAPTCNKEGSAVYVCSRCHDRYSAKLEPLGHDWILTDSISDSISPQPVSDVTFTFSTSNLAAKMPEAFDGDLSTSCYIASQASNYRFDIELFKTVFGDSALVTDIAVDFLIDGQLVHASTADVGPLDTDRPWVKRQVSVPGTDLDLAFFMNYRRFGSNPKPIDFNFSGADVYSLNVRVAEIRFLATGAGKVIPGYDVYKCSRCGEEYIDHDRTGPPDDVDRIEISIGDDGFFQWWRNTWVVFSNDLLKAIGFGLSPGGSGSDGDIPDGSLPGEEEEEDTWHVWDLLVALKDGSWAIVKGTVKTAFGGIKGVVGIVTDIGGFFTSAGEVSDTIKDFGG